MDGLLDGARAFLNLSAMATVMGCWRAALYVVLFASGHTVSLANTLWCG